MLLQLLAKVVNSHIDILHAIRPQTIYIMIDNALASYFEQWFRNLLSKRTKTFTLSTSHQNGINRKF